MSAAFDPYHQWLGIPPHEQPPHFYRLLGLQRFESDPIVIGNAADRQTAFLRSLQAGPYAADAVKLLGEVSAARAALLAPEKKAAYDAQLWAALSLVSAAAAPAPPAVGFSAPPPAPPPAPSAPPAAPAAQPLVVQMAPTPDIGLRTLCVALLGAAIGVVVTVLTIPKFFESTPAGAPRTTAIEPSTPPPAPPRANSILPEDVDSRPAWPRTSRPAGRGVDPAPSNQSPPLTTIPTPAPAPSGSAAPALPAAPPVSGTAPAAPAPAPKPTPPAVAQIDPKSPVVVGNWQILANGEVQSAGVKWERGLFVFGDPEWRDYDLSVELFETQDARRDSSHLSADRPMIAAVVVRADATGKNYWWVDGGSVGPPNEYQLLPFFNGEPAWGDPGRQVLPHQGPSQVGVWYQMLVQVRGYRVRLFVDGREIASGENSRLLKGRVGLATNDQGYAKWRNLEVRDPSGTVLWKGWPAPSFVQPAASAVIPAAAGTPRIVHVLPRNAEWQGAVHVEKGTKITVTAGGRWSYGWRDSDADGDAPSDFAPIGYLEARLNGWPIRVGKQSTFFAVESGDLQFRMRDWDYRDNGANLLDVHVVVEPPPATLDPLTRDGRPLAEHASPTDPRFKKRRAVPKDAMIAVAKERVAQLFSHEADNAKTSGLKAALAQQMLARGLTILDDDSLRFALIDTARRHAAESGQPDVFLPLTNRQADEFVVERWPLIAESLQLAAGARLEPAPAPDAPLNQAQRSLLAWSRSLAAEALAEQQPQAAIALAGVGVEVAAAGAEADGAKRFAAQVAAWIKLAEGAAAARTTLATDPENAAAHRTLGLWLTLFEEEADEGRPHLLKSADAALQTLAEHEQISPDDAAGAIALADEWLKQAASAPADEQPYYRLRARRWFFAASGQAIDREAQRCEQMLAELEPEQPLQVRQRFVNSLGMKFVWCPPGEFRMGSPSLEAEREIVEGVPREQPHRVRLTKGFWLSLHETTQAEYAAVMGVNPSDANAKKLRPPAQAADVERFPVESVTYPYAYEFSQRLSRAESREYRLPSEAEWEYACRAGTSTPFSFGATSNGREANLLGAQPYGSVEKGPSLGRPTSVGSYPANPWGFYDLHGNVWEWCADPFENAYPVETLLTDPRGPLTGKQRAQRGGAWAVGCAHGRSASRRGVDVSTVSGSAGFRLVLEP